MPEIHKAGKSAKCKELYGSTEKEMKMLHGEILALERPWRIPSISVSVRRFQIAKNRIIMFLSVVRCKHAYERKKFRLGTSGQELEAQIYQKEKLSVVISYICDSFFVSPVHFLSLSLSLDF